MFKKSPKTKQFNLFSSPSGLMCERESRMYDDASAWHNKFYKQVTSKVDEDISCLSDDTQRGMRLQRRAVV